MKQTKKYSLLSIALLFIGVNFSYSQNLNSKPDLIIFKSQNVDSTIISTSAVNKIFIEKDPDSEYYEKFTIDKKANSLIPIYKYSGKYYLYYPCDLGNLFSIIIKDSIIQISSFEIEDYKILKKQKQGKNNIYIVQNQVGEQIKLSVTTIDKNKLKVDLFKNGVRKTFLMINSHYRKHYPIIVNDCKTKVKELF